MQLLVVKEFLSLILSWVMRVFGKDVIILLTKRWTKLYVESTKTTVDDRLRDILVLALDNEDYRGLMLQMLVDDGLAAKPVDTDAASGTTRALFLNAIADKVIDGYYDNISDTPTALKDIESETVKRLASDAIRLYSIRQGDGKRPSADIQKKLIAAAMTEVDSVITLK